MARKRLPERIYVERWPEVLDRDDRIYFEPTGYGVDWGTGATSTITVYVREVAKPAPKRRGKPMDARKRTGWR